MSNRPLSERDGARIHGLRLDDVEPHRTAGEPKELHVCDAHRTMRDPQAGMHRADFLIHMPTL